MLTEDLSKCNSLTEDSTPTNDEKAGGEKVGGEKAGGEKVGGKSQDITVTNLV